MCKLVCKTQLKIECSTKNQERLLKYNKIILFQVVSRVLNTVVELYNNILGNTLITQCSNY